jgi:large subunit ribosomal protein L21e
MSKKKSPREKGKFKMSKMFYEYNKGDHVTLIRDLSFPSNFAERINGKIGKVIGKKGKFYIVELRDLSEIKHIVTNPIHLKPVK